MHICIYVYTHVYIAGTNLQNSERLPGHRRRNSRAFGIRRARSNCMVNPKAEILFYHCML